MTQREARTAKEHFHIRDAEGALQPQPYRSAMAARAECVIGPTEIRGYKVVKVMRGRPCPCLTSSVGDGGKRVDDQPLAELSGRKASAAMRGASDKAKASPTYSSSTAPEPRRAANSSAVGLVERYNSDGIAGAGSNPAASVEMPTGAISSPHRSAEGKEGDATTKTTSNTPNSVRQDGRRGHKAQDTANLRQATPAARTCNGNPSMAHEETNYLNARSGGGYEGD